MSTIPPSPSCTAEYPVSLRGLTSSILARWAASVLVVMGLLFALPAVAPATEGTEFVLVDGTVVRGILNSFDHGFYTINSNTLGTLRIEAAKVKSIRMESGPEPSTDALHTLQKRMEGDAAIMDLVKSLQQDPDFQAILTDKEIVRAITSGDLKSLEHNQKILDLTKKSTVREIERKLH